MMLGPYETGPNGANHGIFEGQAQDLAREIPDESVSLILCDPVYDDLAFYEFVAREGARILRPGGNCVVQVAHFWLEGVMRHMSRHLQYLWICSEQYSFGMPRMWGPRIFVGHKPWLWYWKAGPGQPISERLGGWARDSVKGSKGKEYHEWGDGVVVASAFLPLSWPEDPVVDLCTGGGTVPAACKMAGRPWLAFERDPKAVAVARERLAGTAWPLIPLSLDEAQPKLFEIEGVSDDPAEA